MAWFTLSISARHWISCCCVISSTSFSLRGILNGTITFANCRLTFIWMIISFCTISQGHISNINVRTMSYSSQFLIKYVFFPICVVFMAFVNRQGWKFNSYGIPMAIFSTHFFIDIDEYIMGQSLLASCHQHADIFGLFQAGTHCSPAWSLAPPR